MRYESLIKVNIDDDKLTRRRGIIEGLGYACAILQHEYGVPAYELEDILAEIVSLAYETEENGQ